MLQQVDYCVHLGLIWLQLETQSITVAEGLRGVALDDARVLTRKDGRLVALHAELAVKGLVVLHERGVGVNSVILHGDDVPVAEEPAHNQTDLRGGRSGEGAAVRAVQRTVRLSGLACSRECRARARAASGHSRGRCGPWRRPRP